MARVREWVSRLWASVRPSRSDADLEEELRLHLELATEEEQRRMKSPEDARRAARVRLGGTAQAVDALRDQRGLPWLEDLTQDLRYALRTVRRTPLFAAVIVLSLALGIGANTALVSLIEATLLRELPVEAPHELVYLQWQSREWFPDMARFAGSGTATGYSRRSPTFSNSVFNSLRAQARTLSEVFAFNRITAVNAIISRGADGAKMQLVSGRYFKGLRVRPVIGRILTNTDDSLSSEPAAVISHRFWERRFDRDAAAIGTLVVLDGVAFTIVGVAPEEFRGAETVSGVTERPDFWIPLAFASRFGLKNAEQDFWWLSVMGRMHPGATAGQVRDNLAGTFRAVVRETESPPPDDVPELHVHSARRGARQEGPEDELEHAVILGAIFGVLLFIVCLNVANLLLSRSAARRTEIGVRLALGASRGRVIRQLLTESVCLAIAGGTLGIVLAYWGKELFGVTALVARDLDLKIDTAVFAVTLLVSALTGFFFGLVPALRATRIRNGGIVERLEIRGGSPSLLNRSLLVTQVATSVVLLVGAGLFVRTLGKWNEIDAGFDTDNLLVFQISPEPLAYDVARTAILTDRLVTRIRAVPGVLRATASGPFWEERAFGRISVDGETRRLGTRWLPVRHDFFATLGLPVLAGRGFLADENQRRPDVAVIEEALARRLFGHSNPIGRRFAVRAQGPEMEIVGIVGNMWMPGTQPDDIRPTIYLPAATRPADFNPENEQRRAAYRSAYHTSFEIRTASDPMAVLPDIRAALGEVEPNLPLLDPRTVVQGIHEKLEPTRVVSLIWLSFGSVALVLTAVGLYGLLAFSVAQRTREIGIRTALGARQLDIIRLVTGQTSLLVSLGIAIGLTVSMAVNQLIRAYIFGVTFYDPATIVGVLVILIVVTSTAAFLPARRASRVDPTVALRRE